MYAVIKTGGKQYKVAKGDVLRIEKLEVNEGDTVDFSEVLMLTDGENIQIGTPIIESTKVTATVRAQIRDKKVKIVKFRRRKHHRKQMGHRQYLTEIEITDIQA